MLTRCRTGEYPAPVTGRDVGVWSLIGAALAFICALFTSLTKDGVMSALSVSGGESFTKDVCALVMVGLLGLAFYFRAPHFPGVISPPRVPVLGQTIELATQFDRMQDWLLKYTIDFGGDKTWSACTMSLGTLGTGALVLTSPESIKHVLKSNFRNYEKGPEFRACFSEFLGGGIFNSDGEAWKSQRKTAAHMFSKQLLRNSTGAALAQARKLLAIVDDHAKSGEAFDIQKLFYNFTMDTFCFIAFGIELNSQDRPHAFAQAFDVVQEISNRRIQNPLWKLCRLVRMASERRLTAGVRVMRRFARDVIDAKRMRLGRGETLGQDLISNFLVSAKRAGLPPPSNKFLRDVVLNFIIAGRDTTAAGLSWTILEVLRDKVSRNGSGHAGCREHGGSDGILVQGPTEDERICREVSTAVKTAAADATDTSAGSTGGSEAQTRYLDDLPVGTMFDVINRGLPRTKAVVSEGLRLHPSVPKDMKFAINEDTLPDGTAVPAGAVVVYSPYAMGRNPLLWEDPLLFKPSRWLAQEPRGSENETPTRAEDMSGRGSSQRSSSLFRGHGRSVSDYHFPVFNAGPRLCLGRPLAFLEMQMIIAMLLPRYELSPASPEALCGDYVQTIVPPIKGGLWVKAKRRRGWCSEGKKA
jgi:cytochrome P450